MQPVFIQQNSNGQQQPASHLVLPERNNILFIKFYDIISVKALSNYCKVYCRSKPQPILVAKTLKWFAEKLPAALFTRVHHGYMVNRTHIVSVTGNTIFLENGISAYISRRKRTTVARALRA